MIYVCDKLLPLSTWNMIATTVQQDQVQLRLLKVFAEMCAYCDVLENEAARLDAVYTVLRVFVFFEASISLFINFVVITGIYANAAVE